jgi:hypothetical protein
MGPAFTPLQLDGLLAWYRADQVLHRRTVPDLSRWDRIFYRPVTPPGSMA